MSDIPESWRLAFALDKLAQAHGWTPVSRMTSREEVTVVYRKDPMLARVADLPHFPKPNPPIEDHQ